MSSFEDVEIKLKHALGPEYSKYLPFGVGTNIDSLCAVIRVIRNHLEEAAEAYKFILEENKALKRQISLNIEPLQDRIKDKIKNGKWSTL